MDTKKAMEAAEIFCGPGADAARINEIAGVLLNAAHAYYASGNRRELHHDDDVLVRHRFHSTRYTVELVQARTGRVIRTLGRYTDDSGVPVVSRQYLFSSLKEAEESDAAWTEDAV